MRRTGGGHRTCRAEEVKGPTAKPSAQQSAPLFPATCETAPVRGYTMPDIILYIIYPFTGCGGIAEGEMGCAPLLPAGRAEQVKMP
jgi:hypothetical protein